MNLRLEKFHSKGLAYACKQNLEDLEQTDKGLHCHQCKRTLVDFTNKSKREYRQITEATPNGCGVFYDYQINNEYEVSIKRPILILSFLSSFLLAKTISAQTPHNNDLSIELDTSKSSQLLIEETPLTKRETRKKEKQQKKTNREFDRMWNGRKRLYISRRFPFLHYKKQCRTMGIWGANIW